MNVLSGQPVPQLRFSPHIILSWREGEANGRELVEFEQPNVHLGKHWALVYQILNYLLDAFLWSSAYWFAVSSVIVVYVYTSFHFYVVQFCFKHGATFTTRHNKLLGV
jgi:hypothetical protein